MSSLLGSGM